MYHASNADTSIATSPACSSSGTGCLAPSWKKTLPEPCRFGITKPIHSFNPLTLTFHEWREMLQEARGLPRRAKLAVLLA